MRMVSLPGPKRVQMITLVALGTATVLMVVMNFVPWQGWDFDGFGTDGAGSAGPWDVHQRFGDGHDQHSWFSSDFKNDDGDLADGVLKIRMGAVLFAVATAAATAGWILFLFDQRLLAAGTAAGGWVCMLLSLAMVNSGIREAVNIHPYWHAGTYLAVFAGMALFVGAVLAFLPTPRIGMQERLRKWAESDRATDG